jgi:acyl-CoA thioester hydrolase
MDVRDYECDMEGIVNNAVYMNYLEHARHGFIRRKGLDFGELLKSDIHLVVIRVEADYLYPLRSRDRFIVTASIERISRLRFGFVQEISLQTNGKLIMRAKVVGTSVNGQGQPKYFEVIERLFDE